VLFRSVIYSNPYALLDDSIEDEVVAQPTKSTTTEKGSKPSDNSRTRNEYPRRGNNKEVVGGNATSRSNTTPGYTGSANNFEDSPAVARAESATTRGGRGGSRGARGGSRGAKNFDRHSRNDRFDGEKKEVAGTGSWGDPIVSELEAVEGGDVVAPAPVDAEPVEPVEPEIEHKTLEQYLAEKNASKKASSVTPRQANEGADKSQWKDSVVLAKEEEDFLVLSKPKSTASKGKPKAEKQFLDIEQKFTDEGRSNDSRGERGGRGGRGGSRGGARGGASSSRSVNVSDQAAFPSLK